MPGTDVWEYGTTRKTVFYFSSHTKTGSNTYVKEWV
jgi:hypothetical protein